MCMIFIKAKANELFLHTLIFTSHMELIAKYFSELTKDQKDKFMQLEALYLDWNSKINVISRKDMDHFYLHHVLHSLGIAKVQIFNPGASVLDVGTGGGFPGVPLAILFPETEFLLVDSIGKKIRVVNEISQATGLKNIKAIQSRAEDVNQNFDFIVSRAVTALPEFMKWVQKKIRKENKHSLRNGVLYLKGGDLSDELASMKGKYTIYDLSSFFEEDFFETKKVVYVG